MTGEQKVRFLLNAGLLNAALQEAIKAKIEVEKQLYSLNTGFLKNTHYMIIG